MTRHVPDTGGLVWSVVIPAHDCADLLGRALAEVVSQLGSRDDVEIVVVDDDSSDDPQLVVEGFGGVVRYERNDQRLGAIGTFNRCVGLARGRYVHLLHGDDEVRPGFYPAMEAALADQPEAVAAMCRTLYIDGDGRPGPVTRRYRHGTGVWPQALRSVVVSNRVRAPSIVVRRRAYAQVGTFRDDLPHAADWEMWTRLLACGPLVFVDAVLACYRRHPESDTAARVRTGANIRERVEALRLTTEHASRGERGVLERVGLVYSCIFATRTATGRIRAHEWGAAGAQLREAARCLAHLPTGIPAGPASHG